MTATAGMVRCPGCGGWHDPEPCERTAATCDCCADIRAHMTPGERELSLADFWAGYAATLARIRAERPDNLDALAKILNAFQRPSAGTAFFGNNADDQLSLALADAGWQVQFLERDYLWEATSPSGHQIHYVEGDVYPGRYRR